MNKIRHILAYAALILTLTVSSCAIGNEDALDHLTINDPLFVAGGQVYIYTSSDGISWQRSAPYVTKSFYGAHYGNGHFTIVGDDSGSGFAMQSDNGTTWSTLSVPAALSFQNVIDLFGMLFFTSNNGLWQLGKSTALIPPCNLYGIAFGEGKYVVSGGSGLAYVSSNGTQWDQIGGIPATFQFYCCVYANKSFVIAGQDTGTTKSLIVVSRDGINGYTTNMITTTSNAIYGIVYGNRRYVAVGAGAQSWYSDDGVTWNSNTITAASGSDIRSIVYGNGLFIAVCSGGSGPIIYSEDGINWSTATCPSGFVQLYAIARRP